MIDVSVEKTTSENERIILQACSAPPGVSLQEDAPRSSHIDPPLQVKTRSYELVSWRATLASGLLILLCGSIEQLGLYLALEHFADLGPR
jgi:hypothetical protein